MSIAILFAIILGCAKEHSELLSVVNPNNIAGARISTDSTYENFGKFYYNQLKYHSTIDDPLSLFQGELKSKLSAITDSMKKVKDFDFVLSYDKALSENKITVKHHDAIINHIKALQEFISTNKNSDNIQKWCLAQEASIANRSDLKDSEKSAILTHQALFRYWLKYKYEDILASKTNKGGRLSGTDPCGSDLCTVNILASYTGAGSFAGLVGAVGGLILGTAYILSNPGVCSCPTPDVCQPIQSVAVIENCLSSTGRLHFSIAGYGNHTPEDLHWQFFLNSDSGPTVTKFSSFHPEETFGEMSISTAELNGAYQVGVRVASVCNGLELWSRGYGWYVVGDVGKPRFMIYNLDGYNPNSGKIGQNSYFGIMGANYVPVYWSVSSMYANVLQNNQYGANFIVQWHNPTGVATVSATGNSTCGSVTQSLSIQTNP